MGVATTLEDLTRRGNGEVTSDDIMAIADNLARVMSQPQVIGIRHDKSKTPGVTEEIFQQIFEAMQARSLERRYIDETGRPVIFYAMDLSPEGLARAQDPQYIREQVRRLMQFAAQVPEYLARATSEYQSFSTPTLGGLAADGVQIEEPEGEEMLTWAFGLPIDERVDYSRGLWLLMRQILTAFANPLEYYSHAEESWKTETDPNYPVLIPIVNVKPGASDLWSLSGNWTRAEYRDVPQPETRLIMSLPPVQN